LESIRPNTRSLAEPSPTFWAMRSATPAGSGSVPVRARPDMIDEKRHSSECSELGEEQLHWRRGLPAKFSGGFAIQQCFVILSHLDDSAEWVLESGCVVNHYWRLLLRGIRLLSLVNAPAPDTGYTRANKYANNEQDNLSGVGMGIDMFKYFLKHGILRAGGRSNQLASESALIVVPPPRMEAISPSSLAASNGFSKRAAAPCWRSSAFVLGPA